MEWDTFACPDTLCTGDRWLVERRADADALWQISDGPADPGFLVAAPEPICPLCGGHLLATLELEGAVSPVRRTA